MTTDDVVNRDELLQLAEKQLHRAKEWYRGVIAALSDMFAPETCPPEDEPKPDAFCEGGRWASDILSGRVKL